MLEFGRREPGWTYEDRPSAYAIAPDAHGRLLCVRARGGLHLPGGGLHAGEGAATACLRELREETGHGATIVREVGRASQLLIARDEGRAFRKLATFFAVTLGAASAEAEDAPAWVEPADADRLVWPFHRWAVRTWETMDAPALARRYVEFSNEGDVDRILPLFAPDATYRSSQTGEHEGVAAIEGMMRPFFARYPDAFWAVDAYRPLGDDGAEFDFEMRGTDTETAAAVARHGTERVFFDPQGRIRRVEVRAGDG